MVDLCKGGRESSDSVTHDVVNGSVLPPIDGGEIGPVESLNSLSLHWQQPPFKKIKNSNISAMVDFDII